MANSVRTLNMEAEDNAVRTKRIFNPLLEDFTVPYAGIAYTVPSNDMAEFSLEIANHIQKHLITHILNKKNNHSEEEREKARKLTEI